MKKSDLYYIYFCRVSLKGHPAKINDNDSDHSSEKKNSDLKTNTLPDLETAVKSKLRSLNTFSNKGNLRLWKI